METGVGTSLTTVFDYVWERFVDRLGGLNDEEYFWEPVAGCWSVRPAADGRWTLDDARPEPTPAPFTTIAWRIGHVGEAIGGFGVRLFGSEGAVPDLPGTANGVGGFLDANYRRWRAGMANFSDDQWRELLGPAWGPYATSTTADLALHTLDELVHHAAEIGVLRDLYANRATLTAG